MYGHAFVFVISTFLFLGVICNAQRRAPRFIRGYYTSTVIEKSLVTSLVPSSCVQVDATLPPCRSVRFLRFPQFTANQPQSTNESHAESKSEPIIHTTQLGWGEYLGMYAPTVTVTEIDISTTIVQDPRIVVTFAVKGCRPNEIPRDLDRCPMEATSVLPIQDALPTSTVTPINASPTKPTTENTKVVNIEDAATFPIEGIDEVQGNYQNLEGTPEINDNLETARATAPLSF